MYASLFDQLSDLERGAVAALLGATDGPGFRTYLRETPPIAEPFVLGEAARSYLRARLKALHDHGFFATQDGKEQRLADLVRDMAQRFEPLDPLAVRARELVNIGLDSASRTGLQDVARVIREAPDLITWARYSIRYNDGRAQQAQDFMDKLKINGREIAGADLDTLMWVLAAIEYADKNN